MDRIVDQLGALFAEALGAAVKGSPSTSPTASFFHGPGGLFGGTAIEEQVISLRIAPRGVSKVLRAIPSVTTHPEFGYITGVTEDAGQSEPSTECATCPSGTTQTCVQTAQFGYICRETKTLTPQRAIERINRADIDFELVNDILGDDAARDFFQPIGQVDLGTVMQVATAWAMIEVGILLQQKLVPMIWQGNPANSVGTGYKEFPGLDILIGTNKVDAHTGDSCPALDSDVKDFNYQALNTTDATGNFLIVRELEYMEAYLYHNAERQGFLPVEWVVCMRPELWYELSMIWPVAWLTTHNIVMPTGTSLSLDASRVREMTEEMRRSMTIWLNGRRHRVVLDDGIFEYNSTNDANVPAGSFASNIYFLPLTYLGQRPATYLEHKDYRAIGPELTRAKLADQIWTDNGRFLWTWEREKFCYTISGITEPRIVLRTPQLAGKLQHVLYSPAQHFRSPWQDSDYFFKGGVSERPAPSLYSDWNLP